MQRKKVGGPDVGTYGVKFCGVQFLFLLYRLHP
jgi:hypothetical protein